MNKQIPIYPSRNVENTIMHTLNELLIVATKGAQTTYISLTHFLNYCLSKPDTEIIYRKGDIILTVKIDAVYIVASKSRSRAARYFYLVNKDGKLFNGNIFILDKVIKKVISSVSESECVGLYMNAQEPVPIKNTLIGLGHLKPLYGTPVRTYNITANGILNRTVKPKKPKIMDMIFWWIGDRVLKTQFRILWTSGNFNLSK